MADNDERMTLEDLQATFDGSPFISFLGLRAEALDYDAAEVTCRMPMNPSVR